MRTRFPGMQQGVALVEFALILPMLLVMTFMTTEFGRALYQYNALTKSVRDAARYLTTQAPGSHQEEAANLIVYGTTSPTAATPPLARGLTTSHVQQPVWETVGANPMINVVTVRISGYQFQSMFSTAFGRTFGTYTFSDITASMRSHL